MGSKLTERVVLLDADAPAVARLREAGATAFAQSTSLEYGHKGVPHLPLNGIMLWNPPTSSNAGRLLGRRRRGGGGRTGADRHRHRRRRPDPGSGRAFNWGWSACATFGRVLALAALADRRSLQHRPDGPAPRSTARDMNVIARPDARDAHALPDDDTNYGIVTTASLC